MIKNKNAISALLAVFPTLETLQSFSEKSENKKIVDSFVAFAAREGVIDTDDKNDFITFIQTHERDLPTCTPPPDLNLEELLKQKKELLQTGLSERSITDRVNALIEKKQIQMPKISNTMLTRLKKEPADTAHKRNTLRCFAFWLGYDRTTIDPCWNYETLLKLCQGKKQTRMFNEGVRIGLTLSSRGDVIGHDAVQWLINNLKDYIKHSINLLPYGNWGKVKSYDITTLYIDFPKDSGANYPASYQRSIRNAVSVAHQIAIRWALSDYCTKKRFLSIGLAAGEFSSLDNYLLPILNAKLPGDPVIRMTDYTHQCILISDIRTVFCPAPKEITLFNGENLDIWWVMGLWSYIYWDFIPCLLDDDIMHDKPSSVERLNQILMFPDQLEEKIEPNAITRFFSFPHNSLLGIEIAKTLFYRRRFWEANEILGIVLSIEPNNLNARSLRMVLYRNLAIEAPSHSIAQIQFKKAEQEAKYVLANCSIHDEDFYCEYGVVRLSKAVNTLQRVRQNPDMCEPSVDISQIKSDILNLLTKAEHLFEKAVMISPTGYRSIYLQACAQVLKNILMDNDDFCINPEKPIAAPSRNYKQKALDIFIALNWLRMDLPEERRYHFLEKFLIQGFGRHDESITLTAYRPTIYFCFAVVLWDFSPNRTVNCVKTAIQLLQATLLMARDIEEKKLCIYSYTRCSGEMLEPQQFIRHIEKSIRMIEANTYPLDELEKKDPSQIIDIEGKDNFSLLAMHI